MQIQALDCRCRKPHFLGVKPDRKSFETPKEMSNEEVLALAKTKMAKRQPTFTPKQKEILPIVDDFNSSEVLDVMQGYLEEADDITEKFRQSGKKSACFNEGGKHYCYKKTQIPESHGYEIKISAQDFDGEEIYNYTSRVRGGYSKHKITSQIEDFGKVEITRQGRYGSSKFSVNNLEQKDYYFSGDINEDGQGIVDNIMNFA